MRTLPDLFAYVERMPAALAAEPVPVSPEEYLMLVNHFHDQAKTPMGQRKRIADLRLCGHVLRVLRD